MLQEAKENGTKLLPERATFLPLLDSLVGDSTNLEDVATVQTCGIFEIGIWGSCLRRASTVGRKVPQLPQAYSEGLLASAFRLKWKPGKTEFIL